MLDRNSYLTESARKELSRYKSDFIAEKIGVSRRRAIAIVRGEVRVLAVEKALIEELLEEVAA